MKGLNVQLSELRDGAKVPSVELFYWNGPRTEVGNVYVYWPLVIFKTPDNDWNVTHALTGYNVTYFRSKRAAEAFAIEAKKRDWTFYSPRSRKVAILKRQCRGLIKKLKRVN